MTETIAPDICVIGGGPGGLSVAAAAAAFGVPTVLIERGKMGGDCLNTGCVPSKTLLAVARRAEVIRGAGAFGLDVQSVGVNFGEVHNRVRAVIACGGAHRFRSSGSLDWAFGSFMAMQPSKTGIRLRQGILKSVRGDL